MKTQHTHTHPILLRPPPYHSPPRTGGERPQAALKAVLCQSKGTNGTHFFEIELKVALAEKESKCDCQEERDRDDGTGRRGARVQHAADGDSAPSGMARRARRDGVPRRLAGVAASNAILEAVEDRGEEVGAAERRATAAEQRECAILAKSGAIEAERQVLADGGEAQCADAI